MRAVTILVGIALGVLLIGAGGSFGMNEVQVSPVEYGLLLPGWFPLLDLRSNAFFSWRTDPVLLNLLAPFLAPGSTPASALAIVQLAVFSLGCCVLMRLLAPAAKLPELATVSFVIAALVYFWLGADHPACATLCWLPWSAVGLIIARLDRWRLAGAVLCLFLALRLANSANQLAPAALLFALMVSSQTTLAARPTVSNRWLIGLMFLICLSPLLTSPGPMLPDYPPLSHVVPDDGLSGLLQSLFGPALPIQLIDGNAVSRHFSAAVLAVTLIGFISFGLLRLRKTPGSTSSNDRMMGVCLLVLSAALALDTLTPASLAQIGPLAALQRLIPHWIFFSLVPVGLSISFFLLGLMYVISGHSTRFIAAAAIIGAAGFLPSPVQRPQPQQFQEALTTLRGLPADAGAALGLDSRAELRRRLISPSYQLLNRDGIHMLLHADEIKSLQVTSAFSEPPDGLDASSRAGPSSLRRALDGRPESRWSERTGQQSGSEWFYMYWSQPRTLRGLVLDTGPFQADFPRGLRISYGTDCASTREPREEFAEIVSFSDWQGAVDYTPDGFPYYAAQSKVQVVFPASINVGCLLIEQTGKGAPYDWSISEIGFIGP